MQEPGFLQNQKYKGINILILLHYLIHLLCKDPKLPQRPLALTPVVT